MVCETTGAEDEFPVERNVIHQNYTQNRTGERWTTEGAC
jgi:hypothetical protein